MKTKRLISLLVCIALLLSMCINMVACDGDKDTDDSKKPSDDTLIVSSDGGFVKGYSNYTSG